MSRMLVIAGLAVLLVAWAGPLPRLVPGSFAAHMLLHMSVVGIGVPLLAIGFAPRLRAGTGSALVLPIVVSLLDFVVVCGWHAPALHNLSRSEPLILALEQASFAGVALLVWLVAFAGPPLADAATLSSPESNSTNSPSTAPAAPIRIGRSRFMSAPAGAAGA